MSKPKPGQAAIVYGRTLEVTGLKKVETADGTRTVAVLQDAKGLKRRAEAAEELRAAREREAARVELDALRARLTANRSVLKRRDAGEKLSEAEQDLLPSLEKVEGRVADLEARDDLPGTGDLEGLRARLDELDQAAREALVDFRLRVDLLDWWEEREVWVSDGRILSNAQRERYQELVGMSAKLSVGMHRSAYDELDRQGLLQDGEG